MKCETLEPMPGQLIVMFFENRTTVMDTDLIKTHKVGTVAEIICHAGFSTTSKVVTRACLEDGTWAGNASQPQCVNGN